MKKLAWLLFPLHVLLAVSLLACRAPVSSSTRDNEIADEPSSPTADVVEAPVEIVTPEPTPTTAVCTPLPDGMTLSVRYASDLHGAIWVEGLQPGEKPTLLLSGETPTGSLRHEIQFANPVEADGHFQAAFDFRSLEPAEGQEFGGQLIHQRGVACFAIAPPTADDDSPAEEISQLQPATNILLADYPPSETPYFVERGDFWLVHAPTGKLYAFTPTSPDYISAVARDSCRFVWTEAVQRFVDPCSGDEWELNGRFNETHSSERWSNRDLTQYPIFVQDGAIFAQLDQPVLGLPVDEPPLALVAQHGVTVTAVTADFSPTATLIDTVAVVDPVWEMDPTAFPPQQALTYFTFPDSLFDDQGHSFPSVGREDVHAVFDPRTGGLQQMMHNRWEPVPRDVRVLTATLMIDLNSVNRQVVLPLDWDAHQAGDTWQTDVELPLGYAALAVPQVEWVQTLADGRARLRLTLINANPEAFHFTCLNVDTSDPWQQTCANFDDEQIVSVDVQPGEPVALHLRASIEIATPFMLVLDGPAAEGASSDG